MTDYEYVEKTGSYSHIPAPHVMCCLSSVRRQREVNWDGCHAQSCLLVISHRLRLAMAVSADGYGSDIVKVYVIG